MKNKIKVLVVEDEVIVARYLCMELETKGFDVCGFVVTGEEAVEMANKKNLQLILMDVNLAGETDGIQAAEKIWKYKKIPIIFMTGYPLQEIEAREKNLKPARHLNKPVEVDQIKPIYQKLKEL